MRNLSDRIENEIENRFLHALAQTWDEFAWYYLRKNIRDKMTKPVFRIFTGKRHGYWNAEAYEIGINRNLLIYHPWDSVCDVLKHEMAHQLADLLKRHYGRHDETPHGRTFVEACRLLRADPTASGTYPTLKERIKAGHASENDKILEKIEKLLALADSSNVHEAEEAMRKANELMIKYNCDIIERSKKRNFVSMHIGRPALRHSREEYALGRLLVQYYFVEGIWVKAFIWEKNKFGTVFEVTGTNENIVSAEYIYFYLKRYIEAEWKKYKKHKRMKTRDRTAFGLGIISGFEEKLESNREKTVQDNRQFELIKIGNKELQDHMSYSYPRRRSISHEVHAYNKNILDDGKEIGRNLVINKAVGQETANRGKLLN